MKAVIFDCDGTLVDSEVLSAEVLAQMLGEQGLTMTTHQAHELYRGGKLAECLADVEQRFGRSLPPDFVRQYRSRTAEAFRHKLKPIDGALELVSSLKRPFSVASSGPREKIELSLSLTGLLPFFRDAIFSSYEVGTWKPDPGIFLHAARVMGVQATDCVVVEDSLPGIHAGIAAGMRVFAFQPLTVDARIPSGVTLLKHLSELTPLLAGG